MKSLTHLFALGLLVVTPIITFANDSAPTTSTESPSFDNHYLVNSQGCAIAVGGSVGSTFLEKNIASFWHDVNKDISDHLYRHLILEKYRVVRSTISVSDAPNIKDIIIEAMSHHKCNQLFQLSNDIGEDSQGKYFGFRVSLLRIIPKDAAGTDGTNTTVVGSYTRTYRFPRNTATFNTFRTGNFARTAFEDIKASGALASLQYE